MKRKFTMLFALLLCMGAWAQTSLRVSEGLLATQENTQYKWTSEKITAPEGGFNKLRVTFLQTSNNEKPAGFPTVAIAEFYLYDKNGETVALTADRFSSNATHVGEGSIEAICDGNISDVDKDGDDYDWYWHSQWSGTPTPYGYHYLEVDVTGIDATSLSEFSIGWVTRRAQASPAEIVISTGATTAEAAMNANSQMMPEVSTEFVKGYTIKSVRSKKYLTYSEESAKPVQNSSVTENGYWYFTEGTDGKIRMHNVASGKVLGTNFEMSEEGEWYISPAGYRPGVVFSKTDDVSKNNCIDDQSGSIGSWSHNAGDEEGTTWLVEEASVVDIEAVALSLQGMKISSIGAAATEVVLDQWYLLNNVGRGNYVSQEQNNWKMRATNNFAVGQSASEKAGYLFKIIKSGEYYNIVSGNSKYFKLGNNSAATSASPVNFEIGLIGSSADNFYIFDKDNSRAADGQASGNNFVGWATSIPTNAGGNDSYRLLPVSLEEITATDELKSLIEVIEAMDIEGRDAIGYYTVASATALNDAVTVAQAKIDAANATDEDVATLQAALDGLKMQLPEAGKFYRIMNDGGTGYLSTGTGTGLTQFVEGIGELASSVFYYTGTKLVDYTTGLYLANSSKNFLHYTETVGEAAGTTIGFAASPVSGKLLISFNNNSRSFYSNGTGDSNAASPGQTGEHYRFTVTEVEYLPVAINTTVGYGTLYSPVALSTYKWQSTTEHRVEAYVAGDINDGILTLTRIDETDGIIPANTPVILKYVADYDETKGAVYLEISDSEKEPVESKLKGTFADEYITEASYVLGNGKQGVGLYKAALNINTDTSNDITEGEGEEATTTPVYDAFLNNGFKAYLPAPAGAQVAMFGFGRGEGTTAVDNVELTNDNVVIYDLAGRRVEKMEKGIYIVNGKKVIK